MYLAYKKNDKEKMRDRVSELMVLEKKLSLVEYVSPMIETIQAQAKTLRKEKKCREDFLKEVSTMIYLADILNIPAFLRVKNQLPSNMERSLLIGVWQEAGWCERRGGEYD